jgi:hypothetical protein
MRDVNGSLPQQQQQQQQQQPNGTNNTQYGGNTAHAQPHG